MADDRVQRLQPFIGEWQLETSLGPPGEVRAVAVFEWALGGAFLVERSEVDVPGVVRLYAMTLDGRTWTLTREQPDFTPLEFAQRYIGTFSDDGSRITGRWEIKHPGQDWQTDFEMNYIRVSAS